MDMLKLVYEPANTSHFCLALVVHQTHLHNNYTQDLLEQAAHSNPPPNPHQRSSPQTPTYSHVTERVRRQGHPRPQQEKDLLAQARRAAQRPTRSENCKNRKEDFSSEHPVRSPPIRNKITARAEKKKTSYL